jgi:hypothetical protein
MTKTRSPFDRTGSLDLVNETVSTTLKNWFHRRTCHWKQVGHKPRVADTRRLDLSQAILKRDFVFIHRGAIGAAQVVMITPHYTGPPRSK